LHYDTCILRYTQCGNVTCSVQVTYLEIQYLYSEFLHRATPIFRRTTRSSHFTLVVFQQSTSELAAFVQHKYGILRCITCILTVIAKQAVLISASIVKQRCNSCILSTENHIYRSCESTCKTNSDILLVFHISLWNLTHLNGTKNVYLTYDICILNLR